MTRERQVKEAFAALKAKWGGSDAEHVTRWVKLPSYPKVSVIVCSYNGAQTLGACLASLLEIDYPDYEIVLVDDGSTDRTPEIIRGFAGQPKLVPVRQRTWDFPMPAMSARKRHGRYPGLYRRRLHGGSRLALLPGGNATQRTLCRGGRS